MKVAIIGTGKVGSLLLQYLIQKDSITQILVVNREDKKSEGIKLDTISAFPEKMNKIKVANYSDVKIVDVVVITAGAIMKANQSPLELVEENKSIIKDILTKIEFKKDAVLIVIATQVDVITQYSQKISQLPKNKVIGFGGTLDVNRLKVILSEETGKKPSEISCYFIGEHGKRGFPVFEEKVNNKDKITEKTRNYFSEIAKRLDESTSFGPSKVLSELVDSVISDKKDELCVSCYHPKYELYLTWPCIIGRKGVEEIVNLKLSSKDLDKLQKVVKDRNLKK